MYMMTWSDIGGGQPGPIHSALPAFGRNFMLDLTCSCQHRPHASVQTSKFGVKEHFHPVEALDFVHKMAVKSSFDPEIDSLCLRVIRAVAQVYAFRSYTCINNIWIYRQTMRKDNRSYRQTMRTPEADTISLRVKDEGTCSVAEEVDCIEEELDEQVNSGSVICKKNHKVALEQHYLKVFQPVKALTFIKIMAVSPLADDIDVVDAISTVSQVFTFRRYVFLEHDWIYRETMSLSGSTDETESNAFCSFSDNEQTCSVAQEKERFSVEDEENSEEVDCIEEEFVEQVKSGSVISRKNCKVALEQHCLKVFQPIKALTFIKRMAVSPLVDDVDVVDAISTVGQVYSFRRYVFLEHDWIYRETMQLSRSTDEAEANINCSFSEDEQTCPIAQEEERISDEGKENSDISSVELLRGGSAICKKIIEDPLLETLKYLYSLALDPLYSRGEEHGVENLDAICQRILSYRNLVYQKVYFFPHSRNAGVAERRKLHGVYKVNSTFVNVLSKENIGTADDDDVQYSKKQKMEVVKIHSHDMEDAVALVGRDVDPLRFDADCNSESENNKRQKKNVKVFCSISNMEDVAGPLSGGVVDRVAVPTDCNDASVNSDRQRTKIVNVCCNASKAEGRHIADFRREIPEREKESHSNQRQETVEMNVCSTSNVENRDIADLHRYAESNTMQKTKDVMVCCSISNVEGRDTDTLREIRYCNRESDSNKRQKTSRYDSVFHFRGESARTFPEDNSASAADDQYRSKIPSQILSDNGKLGSLPGKMAPKEIIATLCEGRVGVSPSQCPVSPLSHDNTDLHSSAGAATDLSNRGWQKNRVSQSSCKGNGRHRTHRAAISSMFKQSKTLQYPLNMLYCCPLSKDSPASSCNAEPKSSKTHLQSEQPTTLHMKFSKDCVPPSKEELVKQFRRFGPLDYLKTKVYFNTGSAQVVFLNHLDAKAACNYARRKTIFSGGAVRYWLYDHKQSRRTNSTSASLPSPTGSSVPVLKSCLRVTTPPGKNVRTGLHVKFQSTS